MVGILPIITYFFNFWNIIVTLVIMIIGRHTLALLSNLFPLQLSFSIDDTGQKKKEEREEYRGKKEEDKKTEGEGNSIFSNLKSQKCKLVFSIT